MDLTSAQLPPTIQYWHAEKVPHYFEKRFQTFRHHNPGSQHLLFNESTATAFLEERFTAREVAAFRACAVPAMQSDYFRYCAAYAMGGIYLDVDLRCIGSFLPLLEEVPAQLFRNPLGPVMNGFFTFRAPEHPFLRLCIEVATANIESREVQTVAGVTGPTIFTALVMLFQLGSIDAFLHVAKDGTVRWQPKLMSEVIGYYDRVAEAFEGVVINAISKLKDYVSSANLGDPPENEGERLRTHWTEWESSIYREP